MEKSYHILRMGFFGSFLLLMTGLAQILAGRRQPLRCTTWPSVARRWLIESRKNAFHCGQAMQRRAEECPERVCKQVRRSRVAGRKVGLKHLDGQADGQPEHYGRDRRRLGGPRESQTRVKAEPQWNEAHDVQQQVARVVPRPASLTPEWLKKRLADQHKARRNLEIITRAGDVMHHVPYTLLEQVKCHQSRSFLRAWGSEGVR